MYPQNCGIHGCLSHMSQPKWNDVYGYWICTCDKESFTAHGYRRGSNHVSILHPTLGWVWSTAVSKTCKKWKDEESAEPLVPLPAPDAPDEDGTEPLPLQDQDASEAPASALSAPTEPSPAHTLPATETPACSPGVAAEASHSNQHSASAAPACAPAVAAEAPCMHQHPDTQAATPAKHFPRAMNRSVAEFFARNELAEVLSAPHAVFADDEELPHHAAAKTFYIDFTCFHGRIRNRIGGCSSWNSPPSFSTSWLTRTGGDF